MDIFSKSPQLSLEKTLILGALGLYVYKYFQLKKSGALGGEPDLLLKVDQQKMVNAAKKQFNLNPTQSAVLQGLVDTFMKKEEE